MQRDIKEFLKLLLWAFTTANSLKSHKFIRFKNYAEIDSLLTNVSTKVNILNAILHILLKAWIPHNALPSMRLLASSCPIPSFAHNFPQFFSPVILFLSPVIFSSVQNSLFS